MNFKCRLKTLYLLNFAQNINKGLHVTLTRAISCQGGRTLFDFIVFGKNGKVISMGFRRTVRRT